jgi:hypothetical protein
MTKNTNVSEMLVHVGGDLLQSVGSLQEMQARVDIVITAWNMSLNPRADRKLKLKKFLKKQREFAPNKDALKKLEAEIKRVMKQKALLYPEIENGVTKAEVIEKAKDEYEIKAYFKDKDAATEA